MRVQLKKVYYCDFCKKKGMSAASMSKHEKHCTLNPSRQCGLCILHSLSSDECPICEFSKLRLSGKLREEAYNGYSFEKALADYWATHNAKEIESDYNQYLYGGDR